MRYFFMVFLWGLLTGSLQAQSFDTLAIHQVLDDWHQAATDADAETYFGLMDEGSIFLGTDAGERWTLSEFKAFALPYFNNGKAWSFKAKNRFVFFTTDGKTAWVDELLDTWMGDCRGSGVLQKQADGWKILHYNLAVLVPNTVIDDYLKLLDKGE